MSQTYPQPPAAGALPVPLGRSLARELRPILDAIAASFQAARAGAPGQDVSVSLPAAEGRTLIVSVRTAGDPSPAGEGSTRGLDARQLQRVEETIAERIGETISVSMLSSAAGLSRSHFSNAFRTSVGRTPHAHVVLLRIERAKTLMRETDTPLSEIALATGFADQAHFSNKFRRVAGTTPTRWRRTNRVAAAPDVTRGEARAFGRAS